MRFIDKETGALFIISTQDVIDAFMKNDRYELLIENKQSTENKHSKKTTKKVKTEEE